MRSPTRPWTMAAGFAALTLAATACGGADKPAAQPSNPTVSAATPAAATVADDEYIRNTKDIVDAANWDTAEHVKIKMVEWAFQPDKPTFVAGKPYVVEVENSGEKKHEIVSKDFFRSSAVRKFEDANGEIKFRLVTEFEVFAGKKAELFIIPVMPGSFAFFCEIKGHREKGQEGTITVTGSPPTAPAPEIAKLADSGWVQNPSAVVDAANWDAKVTLRIQMKEWSFTPKDLTLKAGTPYLIQLVNAGTKKHEVVADDLMPTVAFRKAEDASGEYKGVSFNEVEIFPGQQVDLYLIPTKVLATSPYFCEIEGHREKGQEGTVTVAE